MCLRCAFVKRRKPYIHRLQKCGKRSAAKKINGGLPLRFSHNMIKMQKNIEMSALKSEIRMRPATAKDAELFRVLYNDAFRYVNNAQYYSPAYTESLFDKEDYRLRFFLKQNEIVGFCICIPYADHILIDAIGIKKDYRGKGLARSSMHALYDELLDAGMLKAELLVSSANIAAVNLYAKEGFKTQAICHIGSICSTFLLFKFCDLRQRDFQKQRSHRACRYARNDEHRKIVKQHRRFDDEGCDHNLRKIMAYSAEYA
jgi:ribosomal protein S18 acetylase RimI-like enzyme